MKWKIAALEIVNTIESRISQLAAGPLPKTIGNGPMKMTMLELDDAELERIDATSTKTVPKKMMTNPIINNSRGFCELSG
jgi:hypothetical protein